MTFLYDIEILANRCSFSFKELEGDKRYMFVVYKTKKHNINDIPILCNFLNNPEVVTLVSYNGFNYDDLVLVWILKHQSRLRDTKQALEKLKQVNDKLVNEYIYFDFIRDLKWGLYRRPLPFMSIDLQKLHHLDVKKVSLKKVMIILKLDNVLEFEPTPINLNTYKEARELVDMFPTDKTISLLGIDDPNEFIESYNKLGWYDKPVLEQDVEKLDYYNDHDVDALEVLYLKSKDELRLRLNTASTYGLNLKQIISLSRSSLGDKLLTVFYSKYSNLVAKDFKNSKTINDSFYLDEILDSKIKFRSTVFKDLVRNIRSTIIYEDTKSSFSVIFNNVQFDIKLGGLHSKDNPEIFRSEKGKFQYRDADAKSYYPTIIENLKICPAHLNPDAFLPMISYVKNSRFEAQDKAKTLFKEGKENTELQTKADGLKIVINAVYGKLGEITGWLYDSKAMYKVTINGQLYLLNLIERLYYEGIKCISANTDGIVCKVDADKEEIYYEVCKQWEEDFNFTLEYTDYDLYARTNVNSYITIKDLSKGDIKGNVKLKNQFDTELHLDKGYVMPIVAKTLYNYFLHNIPIMETLTNHDDILDFCISINSSKDFDMIYHDLKTKEETLYPRTNRYFASKGEGLLYKRYKTPKVKYLASGKTTIVTEILVVARSTISIINKVKDRNPKSYDINYDFYYKEVQKLITSMEVQQQKLELF
jgi:hypothetical protein